MAAIALDDRAAAEKTYATLLARCDGSHRTPRACPWSCARSLTPSALAAAFLGHDDEAAAHFAQAATIADRLNAPHRAAEARSRTIA
ncbi:hypothetical protein [Nonomuraea sp. NPDC049758]|uniref:hypothetical protein n=1 Tax=Nonomuraea sp. NPDC049758 TaxID=3154360 RepID=UPI00341FD84E